MIISRNLFLDCFDFIKKTSNRILIKTYRTIIVIFDVMINQIILTILEKSVLKFLQVPEHIFLSLIPLQLAKTTH